MPEIQEVPPKYLQIAGHIRDQIVRGDLRFGDEVPSERELAATWSVARPTAARALESLRVQGLVESRQGSGTYVRRRQPAAPRARERYERSQSVGTMYGVAESFEILATEVVAGPDHVVEALQLEAGSEVIRRARLLRGEGRQPIELSTSWFAPYLIEQAPRLLEPAGLRGGTAKYITEVTGRVADYARDQVAARLATAEERRLLELPRPAAVLVYRFTVYDSSDQPIQFDDATYPAQHWAFHQEYPLAR